jgi:DNA polymerase IIIc chi subunit
MNDVNTNNSEPYKFYKVDAQSIQKSIANLCGKLYNSKTNFCISCSNFEMLTQIDKTIWTFTSGAFIPHILTEDTNYQIYKNDVQNVLTRDIANIEQKNFDTIIFVFTADNTDDNNYLELLKIISNNTECHTRIAVFYTIDHSSQIILTLITKIKELNAKYEVWDNDSSSWELIFKS